MKNVYIIFRLVLDDFNYLIWVLSRIKLFTSILWWIKSCNRRRWAIYWKYFSVNIKIVYNFFCYKAYKDKYNRLEKCKTCEKKTKYAIQFACLFSFDVTVLTFCVSGRCKPLVWFILKKLRQWNIYKFWKILSFSSYQKYINIEIL